MIKLAWEAKLDYSGTLWSKPTMTAEIREAIQETAKFAREILPPETPKDTGRMSRSWVVNVGDRTIRIQNFAPYSGFVNYGTRRMKARPVLEDNLPRIEAHFKETLADKVEAKLGARPTKPTRQLARQVANLRGLIGSKSSRPTKLD